MGKYREAINASLRLALTENSSLTVNNFYPKENLWKIIAIKKVYNDVKQFDNAFELHVFLG